MAAVADLSSHNLTVPSELYARMIRLLSRVGAVALNTHMSAALREDLTAEEVMTVQRFSEAMKPLAAEVHVALDRPPLHSILDSDERGSPSRSSSQQGGSTSPGRWQQARSASSRLFSFVVVGWKGCRRSGWHRDQRDGVHSSGPSSLVFAEFLHRY